MKYSDIQPYFVILLYHELLGAKFTMGVSPNTNTNLSDTCRRRYELELRRFLHCHTGWVCKVQLKAETFCK